MWLLIQTNKSNFMNKKILFILFSLFSIISYSQSYENLNKYKGFKEIWIGENINKYKSYIVKIDKKGDLYYGGMPITESDVYYYENSRIKTIFGLEIANIFLVTNYYGNITQINIIPKRPDNSKQILNFYESEFGKPYIPKNAGSAPCERRKSSANLSKYKVVTPGLISFAIIPNVLETIKALSRINSISSKVLITIIM